MKHIDIRFEFEEVNDEFDGTPYLELREIYQIGCTVPKESANGIAESFAQSDFYWVEVAGAVIEVIAGNKYTVM